jgi:hypothetical protein
MNGAASASSISGAAAIIAMAYASKNNGNGVKAK